MKRILIIGLVLCLSVLAFSEENEFTWAKYEMECLKRGCEPSFEEYEYLINNPTDYYDECDINFIEGL